MSDRIEPVDVHLVRAKADLKRAAITIERLRAEVERLMDGLYSVQRELGAAGMAHTTAGLLVARLCMRNYDDRIEELEEKLQQAVHVVDDKDQHIEELEGARILALEGGE